MNFSAAFMLSLCGYIIIDTTSASPFTWLGDSDSIYSLLPSFGGGESSNDWFQQSSGNEDSVDSFTNWLQRLFGGGGSFSNYLGVPSFGVRSRSLFINEEDEHFPFGHFIITPRVPKNPISKKTKKPTKITKHPNLRGPLNPVIPVHWRNAILSKSSDTLMKPYREFKQGDGSPSVISEKLLSNITGGDRFLQLQTKLISPELLETKLISPELLETKLISPELLETKLISPELLETKLISPELLETKLISPEL
ncbi:hypothetical protein M8J77_017371 [Diaphorina citri]|nr:hypothetical protein M8J77_017371 [Diaphorina citri]